MPISDAVAGVAEAGADAIGQVLMSRLAAADRRGSRTLRGPTAKEESRKKLLRIAPSGAAERCCGFWQDDDQDGERERDRQQCEPRGISQSWFIGPLVFFSLRCLEAEFFPDAAEADASSFPMPRRQMPVPRSRCGRRGADADAFGQVPMSDAKA